MPTKRIPIDSVRIGMYLCGIDRPWIDTPFLFHRFLIKSQSQIDKLKQCGVTAVDIDADRGLDVPESREEMQTHQDLAPSSTAGQNPPTPIRVSRNPEERISSLPPTLRGKSFSHELSSMREMRQEMLESVRDLLGSVTTAGVIEADRAKTVAQTIISQTLDHEEACLALIRTREFSPDLYDHSLSVGTLAVLLGRLAGHDEDRLRLLGTAGLLHDVGLLRLPRELIRAKGRLSEPDLLRYRSHPALGVEVLQESAGVPPEVLEIVAQHHVTLDNKGFPPDFPPEHLSYNSRLLRVVDEYDELLTGQHHRHPLSVRDALRELYRQGQHHSLDQSLVTQFINQVGIYPIYSLVELSTGERGIVTANSPDNLLHPTVLLFEGANRSPFHEPVPINFSTLGTDSPPPEIVKVLDPEQEGIRVEKILADWVSC